MFHENDEIESTEDYEWHVEPHRNHQFDTFCTHDAHEAISHAVDVLEEKWGDLEQGEEITVTIKRRQM